MTADAPHTIEYRLLLDDGSIRSHIITLEERAPPAGDAPWTRLGFRRCGHCPLDPERYENCPLAAALYDVVSLSADLGSCDEVDLVVILPEREVRARTSVQRAIGSLIGLVTATSGCPHAHFLRPMALFHLPLACERETIFRATSTYLLSQYFVHRGGGVPDLDLNGLRASYERMQEVNAGIASRLRAAFGRDGAVNAVVMLDAFAKILPEAIEDSLCELQSLFGAGNGPTLRPESRS